jgi:hypothetical protein
MTRGKVGNVEAGRGRPELTPLRPAALFGWRPVRAPELHLRALRPRLHAKPVYDQRGVGRRRFCSKRCTGAHRRAAAAAGGQREGGVPEHPAELMDMSLVQPLTPGQAAKARSYIFGLLRRYVPLAHRVVMGEVHWSPI